MSKLRIRIADLLWVANHITERQALSTRARSHPLLSWAALWGICQLEMHIIRAHEGLEWQAGLVCSHSTLVEPRRRCSYHHRWTVLAFRTTASDSRPRVEPLHRDHR